jgi:hypothetical protein
MTDEKPRRIGKELMNGGKEDLGESTCRWGTLHEHPKYEQWLRRTLFHRSASDATTCSEDSTATKKKNGKKVADDFNFSTTPKSV